MDKSTKDIDPKVVKKWISVLIAILSAIAGAIAGDVTNCTNLLNLF